MYEVVVIDERSKKYKKLMKLYGYEVADFNQKHDQTLDKDAILEGLAVMHLERQVQSALQEFFTTIEPDNKGYCAAYSVLSFVRKYLDTHVVGLTDADKVLVETFSEEWIKNLEEKSDDGPK